MIENSITNQDKLVSVIICTYNGSRFIEEQMDSILNQTYSLIEIIAADDASTDDSFSILEKYTKRDSRIKLYRNEKNLGYTGNFSRACSYASGDYLAISDQDDVWHPEKLKKMMESWKPGVPLMYCNSVRFKTEVVPWAAKDNLLYRRFEGMDCRQIAVFNTISGHALMVTKKFLPLILPFPEKISYDWLSGVVASCHGGVGYVAEILVFQRVHGDNITVGGMYDHNDKKNRLQFKKMVQAHLEKFSNIAGMPGRYQRFFNRLYYLWSQSVEKGFSWRLFFFLIRYRHLIFHYKRRKLAILSHIKHSYRLAGN